LFVKARELGIEIRGGGTRTAPLSDNQLKKLGLFEMYKLLSQMAGRPVSIMLYKTSEAVKERNPNSIYVP
jgi:hypothetical protein